MKKKILIIGSGFLQGFVLRKAKEMGYTTFALGTDIDDFCKKYTDHYECINIVDAEACLKFAKENNIDGVLSPATDFGVITASYIAEQMGLPGLKPEVAKLIKNKYHVRKCLFENQVDDTQQAFEITTDTNIEDIAKKLSFPVMVKPCDGSSSRGASRVDNESQLKQACEYALDNSVSRKAEIESFIDGEEYGVENFVENGKHHVLAVMKKWMTNPPYYSELGHAIPSGLDKELEDKVIDCAKKAIKALGVNFGSVNMDLLITKDRKVHIVDIGARMGGNMIGSHIIPMGTGIDYMGYMIKAALGEDFTFTRGEKGICATRILALSPGKIKALPDFDKIARDNDVIIEHHLAIGNTITQYKINNDGNGYIIATADNVEEAARKADKAKSEIDTSIVRE